MKVAIILSAKFAKKDIAFTTLNARNASYNAKFIQTLQILLQMKPIQILHF